VATCILGIGDRHPGNVLIQEDGHYFHVDFGHILGHFKMCAGVRRDSSTFHFTSAFRVVIDQSKGGFDRFQNLCLEAWKILRKNADLLLNLLLLMLGSGLKELENMDRIEFVRERLFLPACAKKANDPEKKDLFQQSARTDEDLRQRVETYVGRAEASRRTEWNNMFHNVAHRPKKKK
jgi:phosphatidylinositol-4,5-bisphosphate 3-kinase